MRRRYIPPARKITLPPMPRGGINWFDPAQWDLLKATVEDSEVLDDTYEAWLANATRVARELKSQGLEIVEIRFDVAEFTQWCAERGLPLNGGSRAQFASFKVQEPIEEPHPRKKRAR